MWWLLIVDRRAAGERHALDHVGIERALGEKLDRAAAVAGDAARFGVEHVDEQLADRLAFGLGVIDAGERLQELVGRVDMDKRDVEVAAEQAHHLVRFPLPHEPVIDEHAGQLIADRFVDQHRRHRRIDPAGQAADDARAPDLGAYAGDLLVAEGGHRPVAFEAGDLMKEIGDEFCAVGRVHHLRVEHRRIVAARLVGCDRVGRVLRHRVDAEALGQARDPVAMAHPHRIASALVPDAVEESGGSDDFDFRPAEFRCVAALDFAAELLAQGLLTVADGEDRNTALEDLRGRARASRLRNRRRSAGQYHRLGLEPRERFARFRVRVDFAIDPGLAHAARDQLGHLRTEIDDEDEVVTHPAHVAQSAASRNASASSPLQRPDQRLDRLLEPSRVCRISQNLVGRHQFPP